MNQSSSVRVTVFCGLFIALSVVLTRLASVTVPIAGFPSVRLGFGLAPVILAGVLFGPGAGFLVGALSDIMGMFLFPSLQGGGSYFFGLTLTFGLAGAMPSFFVSDITARFGINSRGRRFLRVGYMLNWNKFRTGYRLLIGILLSQLVNSVLLGTLCLSVMYGKAFIVFLPARLLAQAILIPCYSFVVYAVVLIYRQACRGELPGCNLTIPSGR